jgi:hypothetical protein
MKYIVKQDYISEFINPIDIVAGESVICIKESDMNSDSPNWILCKVESIEAWIPKQILRVKGNKGVALEDYSSGEFNLNVGDILVAEKEMNGWGGCYKDSNPSEKAWAQKIYLNKY